MLAALLASLALADKTAPPRDEFPAGDEPWEGVPVPAVEEEAPAASTRQEPDTSALAPEAAAHASSARPEPGPPSRQAWVYYVVWVAEGDPAAAGIWAGAPGVTWRALASRLRGGRYQTGRDHLRRAASREEALRLYVAEAERHEAPAAPAWHRAPTWLP